jgi:oligopeptide transport system substrate-binding protein
VKSRRAWLRLAVLAAGLSLVASGCGWGDDDEEDAGATAAAEAEPAAEQVISVNWGTEPPSLEPGLASDTTSANILFNVMDPLVKLDDALNPVGALAKSWDVSKDGKTVTFHLRKDGTWTNGDPVTAHDFEYSWKRTVSPELAAYHAYEFFGIVGAKEYNGCKAGKAKCRPLAARMRVKAVDDSTLEVKLTTPQPWFIQQVAHTSFLAVNRRAVKQFGAKWTEAKNIVTNGPFKLAAWEHDSRIDLVKWDGWRDAKEVKLTRANGRMIVDGATAVEAFEAGEVDVNLNIPTEEIARIKETEDYYQYPGLGTYYYGLNVKNIPDENQRKAMSLAVDRREIIDDVAQADQLPATGFTPEGTPGFDVINPRSPWTPENGDLAQARKLMAKVQRPQKKINLLLNDSPGHREIAVAIQDAWKRLGLDVTITVKEWARFLEFIAPPPDDSMDVFRLGWIGDYVDAINFLELWTCKSGNNSTNYCDPSYDRAVEKARRTQDNQERYKIYAQLERKLFGQNGAVPIIPIYWYTYIAQERSSIKDTFDQNLLNQIDLTKVEVEES